MLHFGCSNPVHIAYFKQAYPSQRAGTLFSPDDATEYAAWHLELGAHTIIIRKISWCHALDQQNDCHRPEALCNSRDSHPNHNSTVVTQQKPENTHTHTHTHTHTM